MSKLEFIAGPKETIPEKYLEQMYLLMQENRGEIFQVEPPHLKYFEVSWKLPQRKDSEKKWVLVLKNDELIGYGYVTWNVMYDNLDIGYFWCFIRKGHRRKGYGRALLQQLCKLFPNQIKIVQTESFENTAGEKFVSMLNETFKFKIVISASKIREFDPKDVSVESERLKQKAAETGYDIVFVKGIDFAKIVDINAYVKMVEEIWNDMPREELSDEDEVLTPERFEEYMKQAVNLGYETYTYIAIDKETKNPIGLTSSTVGKYQPFLAYQEDTGILKNHRGNGLGLALKYQMLKTLLTETKVNHWQTGNAGSNEHMLRINKKLGYEVFTAIKITEFMKDEWQKFL